MNSRKVIFKIDPEKEYEYHQLFFSFPPFSRLTTFDETSLEDKNQIIEKIEFSWNEEQKKLINEIELKWKTIENDYFKFVQEITGINWLYDEYYAYFLAFGMFEGFSNPFNFTSQEITLTTKAVISPKFLVGHELFHSHYFYIINKLGLANKINKTLFTEGVAALVLSDEKMKSVYGNIDFQGSINSNPVVAKNWPALLELWENRTDFPSFLKSLPGKFEV